MPHSAAGSETFGSDIDDSAFIAVATQIEASQRNDFPGSPRPTKRRRVGAQLEEPSSQALEWPGTDGEEHSAAQQSVTATNRTGEQAEVPSDDIDDDEEYYFPGELEPLDEQSRIEQSKYRIHIPNQGQYQDQIFTQTQAGLDSDPAEFRGAIWKRPKTPPPPVPAFAAGGASLNARPGKISAAPLQRQTTLGGINGAAQLARGVNHSSDAALAARLQAQENAGRRLHPLSANVATGKLKMPSTDISEQLADLPSDAFSSSSPEKLPSRDVIEISSQPTTSQPPVNNFRGPQHGLKQMTIFGQPAPQGLSATQAAKKKHAWPLKAKEEPPTHHKLDDKAMETWIYPTNLGAIRDYQYNIVSRSLFHNTLVALPTGLGKTFIAATVMLNWYRWTKDAQVIFMAPTKPLIAQQMEACYHIVGIPRQDTVLMTGETVPALRAEEWLEKRVFFMTPQTVINDLKSGICDPKRIVLVVVDEAHKATGNYAYTEVIRFLRRFNSSFRVQALTATPGSTVEAVQAVIDHLGIARVELRTEESLDIRQYTHEKHTETELFDYDDEQGLVMDLFARALKPVVEKLCSQNVYWSRDPMQLTTFGLTQARKKWMASDAGRKAAIPIKGMVNSIITVLSSLAHSINLLKFHGIKPFYHTVLTFDNEVSSGKSKGKYATQIAQSEPFVKMMSQVRGWTNNPDFIGHPKLEYLREVVLKHFLDTGEGRQGPDVPPSATRVMIFASWRDSTEEICRVLKRNEPMIRPHVFVGQAASKGSEGMDQKKQNAVIQDFKSGKYNTLVATSIGEEGLDIGDVDLIVCYDASSSPIRMLQRIGRTGRKRMGRVVLLLMRGKEENDYAKAQDNYTFIQKTIADAAKYNYRDDQSPRILPKGTQPVVDKRIIEIPVENSQPIDLNERGKRAKGKGKAKAKRPPKKFHMPDGVRTGFTKASRLGSDDEDSSGGEILPKRKQPAKTKKATPSKSKKPVTDPEPEPMQLPFLADVLLDDEQYANFERQYGCTANDDSEVIVHAPDLTDNLDPWKNLGWTRYIKHGRAAKTIEKAMQTLGKVDNAWVERMKQLGRQDDLLTTLGNASERVVNHLAETHLLDDDLPDNPLGTKVRKMPAVRKPGQTKSAGRTVSNRSNATITSAALPSAPPPKKTAVRPRKSAAPRRTASYGSAVAEGDESSPEPTPAHMRIGTQGIDLGSRDTSGEEEDDEPGSELEEFVVRSDQPIEMASSSQRLPDDTQPPRKRAKKAAAPMPMLFSEDEVEAEAPSSDIGMAAGNLGSDDIDVMEVAAPEQTVAGAARKRAKRVVDDSDTE